jgi:hypothetical protein
MSNLGYEAIIVLLKSEDETNHALGFQLMEGLGVVSKYELAQLVNTQPQYLLHFFLNGQKKLLELVLKMEFFCQLIAALSSNLKFLKNLEILSIRNVQKIK